MSRAENTVDAGPPYSALPHDSALRTIGAGRRMRQFPAEAVATRALDPELLTLAA